MGAEHTVLFIINLWSHLTLGQLMVLCMLALPFNVMCVMNVNKAIFGCKYGIVEYFCDVSRPGRAVFEVSGLASLIHFLYLIHFLSCPSDVPSVDGCMCLAVNELQACRLSALLRIDVRPGQLGLASQHSSLGSKRKGRYMELCIKLRLLPVAV